MENKNLENRALKEYDYIWEDESPAEESGEFTKEDIELFYSIINVKEERKKRAFASLPTKERDYKRIARAFILAKKIPRGIEYIKSFEKGSYSTGETLYNIVDLAVKDDAIVVIGEKTQVAPRRKITKICIVGSPDKIGKTTTYEEEDLSKVERSLILSSYLNGQKLEKEYKQNRHGPRDCTTIGKIGKIVYNGGNIIEAKTFSEDPYIDRPIKKVIFDHTNKTIDLEYRL